MAQRVYQHQNGSLVPWFTPAVVPRIIMTCAELFYFYLSEEKSSEVEKEGEDHQPEQP